MGSGEKPVLFEVKVDTKTGEVDLKRFTGVVEQSMRSSTQSVSKFESALGGIGSAFKAGMSAAAGFAATFGVIFSVQSAIAFFKSTVAGAAAQEQAERKLANALEVRKIAQAGVLDSMRANAAQQEFAIGQDDDLILSQQATATSMGLSTKAAQRLTMAAADASAALGRDFTQVNFLLTRAITTGSGAALTRLGIKLDETTLKSHDANKILAELEKRFAGSAAKSLQTFEGSTKLLNLAWGEFKESIGDLVVRSPAVITAINGIREIIIKLTGFLNTPDARQGIKDLTVALLEFANVGITAARVANALSGAFLALWRDVTTGGGSAAGGRDFEKNPLFKNFREFVANQPAIDRALQQTAKDLEELTKKVKAASTESTKIVGDKNATGGVEDLIGATPQEIGFGIDALIKLEDQVKKLETAYQALNKVSTGQAFNAGLKSLRAEALKLYELGAAPDWFKGMQVALARLEASNAIVDLDKAVQDLIIQETALNELLRVGDITLAQHDLALKVVKDQYGQLAQKALAAGVQIKALSSIKPPEGPLNDVGVPFDTAALVQAYQQSNEVIAANIRESQEQLNQVRLAGVQQTLESIQAMESQYQLFGHQQRLEAMLAADQEAQRLETALLGARYTRIMAQTIKENKDVNAVIEAYEAEKQQIEDRHAKARVAIEQTVTQAKMQMAAMVLNSIGTILGSLFGKSKAAQKAVAIINTAAGVTQALASTPPPASYVLAAAVAAQGYAQVKKIDSTSIGGGTGSTGVGGGGASVGAATAAVNYAGAVQTPGNVTGTTPVVAGSKPQTVNNFTFDVKAIDARSFRDAVLDPVNRRALREATDIESGRR